MTFLRHLDDDDDDDDDEEEEEEEQEQEDPTCACASSLWVSFPSIPALLTSLKHWI